MQRSLATPTDTTKLTKTSITTTTITTTTTETPTTYNSYRSPSTTLRSTYVPLVSALVMVNVSAGLTTISPSTANLVTSSIWWRTGLTWSLPTVIATTSHSTSNSHALASTTLSIHVVDRSSHLDSRSHLLTHSSRVLPMPSMRRWLLPRSTTCSSTTSGSSLVRSSHRSHQMLNSSLWHVLSSVTSVTTTATWSLHSRATIWVATVCLATLAILPSTSLCVVTNPVRSLLTILS